MGRYKNELKEAMLTKMLAPGGPSANELAQRSGVSQTTLSRWLREATTVSGVSRKNKSKNRAGPGRRPQDWPADERLQVVQETAVLEGTELGAYLREQGLHEAVVEQWREAALEALQGKRKTSPERRRIKELEKELHRKDKALAESVALLVLAKKVALLT